MFEWFSGHSQIISAWSNVGMLLVWVAYLQLFFYNYRRQRRAHILVNRGAGRDLSAWCLVSNMSSEPIYIESIIATLRDHEEIGTVSCAVTDVMRRDGEEWPEDPKKATRQGPLLAGEYVEIGSFQSMLDQIIQNSETDHELGAPDASFTLEVTVIADYASENLVVGAKRPFGVTSERGRWVLRPKSAGTEQIRRRRDRRQLEQLKQEYL